MTDVVSMIGSDALESADGDRFSIDATAPAGGLAGSVAGPAEYAREDVRLPVDHVRVGVVAVRDQPDVFRHIGVRRTGPLAVDNLMVVLGIGDVSGAQALTLSVDNALSPSVEGFSRRIHDGLARVRQLTGRLIYANRGRILTDRIPPVQQRVLRFA
jgi:hypothetical protein